MIIRKGSLPSLLAINFLQRKLTSIKKKCWQNLRSMYTEEMKKIGAEPEDEGEEITGEVYFPTLSILKLLSS